MEVAEIPIFNPERQLTKPLPLLVLVKEPDPNLFKIDPSRVVNVDEGEEMEYPGSITSPTPQEVLKGDGLKRFSRLVYEPYLLSSIPLTKDFNEPLTDNAALEFSGFLGPLYAYRFTHPTSNGESRPFVFTDRMTALRQVAQATETKGISYVTANIDTPPKVPEKEDDVYRGLGREERKQIRDFFRDLLESDQRLMKMMTLESTTVNNYPFRLVEALKAVRKKVYQRVDGKSGIGKPEWQACVRFVNPLIDNLQKAIDSTRKKKASENGLEFAAVSDNALQQSINYDFSLNIIKDYSELLAGNPEVRPHGYVFFPLDKLQGVGPQGSSVLFTEKEVVIDTDKGTFRFPLPEKHEGVVVGYKGGVARLITKLLFKQNVSAETPVTDTDIVIFGNKSKLSGAYLEEQYDVDPDGIEWSQKSIGQYTATRDQVYNEVLLTADGLYVSNNAVAGMFQNATEVGADPYHDLFGGHVLTLGREYYGTNTEGDSYVWVRNARFPTPRTLVRMYNSLITGKTEAVVIPEGALKFEPHSHWLTLARKYENIKDSQRQQYLLQRMVELASVVNSKYYQEGDTPETFIARVRESTHKEYGFDSKEGQLTELGTLQWLTLKLMQQIDWRIGLYVGEKEKTYKLDKGGLKPRLILLPEPKNYPKEDESETGETIDPEQAAAQAANLVERRLGLVKSYLESFAEQSPPGAKRAEERIENYLLETTYRTTDYETAAIYLIPRSAKPRFLSAGKGLNVFTNDPSQEGAYNARVNMGYVFFNPERGSLTPDETWALFEEKFHSTARHIVEKTETEIFYAEAFVSDIREERGEFFEEALAGIAFDEFARTHRIDTTSLQATYSNYSAYLLSEMLSSMPEGGRVRDLLMRARIGNQAAEAKARSEIDSWHGKGMFDYLMNIKGNDIEELHTLRTRLGL